MKKWPFITAVMIAFSAASYAQQADPVKFSGIDSSPMDAVYYPLNATKVRGEQAKAPLVKVVYSRPAKKGREIFGVLEQYNKVWRLGANENTEISFNESAVINGKTISPGNYSLFAIPQEKKWTIILNQQTDRWGAFSYDENKDIVRMDVPVQNLSNPVEYFSITFTDSTEGITLWMAWDTVQVGLPIHLKKN